MKITRRGLLSMIGGGIAAVVLGTDARAALEEEARALGALERRATRPGLAPEAPGRSLEAFLFRYLPHAFSAPPGDFHRAIYDDLARLVGRQEIDGAVRTEAALAYPRGHGKSTTVTLGFVAWVLYHWREMPHFTEPPFILIVSDTVDQARDRCLDLRDEIEGNEDLARDYGPQAPARADRERQRRGADGKFSSKAKWTETDWTTRDGCRVRAVGAGSKVRGLLRHGRRPTLIVIDDLENDEAVETKERRTKLERWFTRALLPVGLPDKCLTLLVGTVLHVDALLGRLLRSDLYADWLKRRFAACYTETGKPAAPAPHGPGVRPLWPEFWTLARLARRFRAILSLAFSQEYLNEPIDDENSPFRWEWLAAAMEAGEGVAFMYAPEPVIPWGDVVSTWDLTGHELAGAGYQVVITAWDLALVESEDQARKRDTDFTAGITVGLTADEVVEVRRVFRKRGMTPAELRGRIATDHAITDAGYVVIERNQAQRIVEWDLRGAGIPVVGHTTDAKKRDLYDGVPAMSLLFETGRIRLCSADARERAKIETLAHELHGLGIEAHDDTVMGLWMALRVLVRWQRRRNAERLRLLGPRPVSMATGALFPERVEGQG